VQLARILGVINIYLNMESHSPKRLVEGQAQLDLLHALIQAGFQKAGTHVGLKPDIVLC